MIIPENVWIVLTDWFADKLGTLNVPHTAIGFATRDGAILNSQRLNKPGHRDALFVEWSAGEGIIIDMYDRDTVEPLMCWRATLQGSRLICHAVNQAQCELMDDMYCPISLVES